MSQTLELQPAFDAGAADAFAENVGGIINAGAISVMLSIGHRTGLFDLMAQLPPATSDDIASRAALAERYVREWLAVMVTGGIVRYEPACRTYHLPPEHAACLHRQAELGNLAVYAQFIPMAGAVQEKMLACFETGEGLSYDDYPCFHRIMSEDSAQTVVAQLFDHILPLAPELASRLEQGIDVLDAGCGAGHALVKLARHFPASRFAGYDLCGDAVEAGRRAAAGLGNVRLEVKDLTGFDEVEAFDLVTSFDAIHDQKDPQGLVRAIHRALRPGGVYVVQEIGGSAHLEKNLDFPFAPFLYTASCLHCTPVSLGQGGAGLGTMWGWETAEQALKEAGFAAPERHVFEHDPMNVWFVCRKSPSDHA
ncbi:MAG: class I SAM-dependent methyltransferase [Anderseniella sp.]|jgi:SAM-dependent methyltransferase|nr:class I SAM-dependent methyltransferase [Anderseniella sp.]